MFEILKTFAQIQKSMLLEFKELIKHIYVKKTEKGYNRKV